MYDIRQFKPMLYLLILMGMCGFALASLSPGTFILSTGFVLLHAWLDKTGRFRPLPRLIANLLTVAALVLVVNQMLYSGITPVIVIGQFLVILQIVKLYEHRGNRDYAQLLVLSLLLMVAAAINTASLMFGVLLIIYLFLSLYCCLLFHLKVESESAAAIAAPQVKILPAMLRQDQRFLTRSMRRLTALVAGVSIIMAIVVFLTFPRGTGGGMLGQFQFRQTQTLTGFSDQMSFQQVARITQNQEIVAYVQLWKNDTLIRGTEPLLLRGITLDVYGGNDGFEGSSAWQWSRSRTDERLIDLEPQRKIILGPAPGRDLYRQSVKLLPTGTNVLFTLPGVVAISSRETVHLRYSPRDLVLQTNDPIYGTMEYEALSTGIVPESGNSTDRPRPAQRKRWLAPPEPAPEPYTSSIDPRIAQMARRPEVSGENARGKLVDQRTGPSPDPMDAQIAYHIEQYLQHNYAYTLDLTDARRVMDKDPMVAFLYDFKKGHCEYFAGAMTLMCQSLGMKARVVLGFKVPPDSYNGYGDYYIVRQSSAHAWVEVLTPEGWRSFDPTSDAGAAAAHEAGLWQKMRHLFNFMEYKWADSVVAYDTETRQNLITQVNTRLDQSAVNGSQYVGRFNRWLSRNVYSLSSGALTILVGGMALAIFLAIGWYAWERWKIRRRAQRIGIESLPASDRARLARQLGFYDDLLRLLERHQITRPAHLTPREFNDQLAWLPSDVYSTIRRLTRLYYRIRYGDLRLAPAQQRRLSIIISRLGGSMASSHSTFKPDNLP
jgi:transglutaminase-like putative cysteine protease